MYCKQSEEPACVRACVSACVLVFVRACAPSVSAEREECFSKHREPDRSIVCMRPSEIAEYLYDCLPFYLQRLFVKGLVCF